MMAPSWPAPPVPPDNSPSALTGGTDGLPCPRQCRQEAGREKEALQGEALCPFAGRGGKGRTACQKALEGKGSQASLPPGSACSGGFPDPSSPRCWQVQTHSLLPQHLLSTCCRQWLPEAYPGRAEGRGLHCCSPSSSLSMDPVVLPLPRPPPPLPCCRHHSP